MTSQRAKPRVTSIITVVALLLPTFLVKVHASSLVAESITDSQSAESTEARLSPGLDWCVRKGWSIRVGPYKRVVMPTAYSAATEKFAPQVKLGADTIALENYVAGLPFPVLDTSDPQAGVKIAWNVVASWRATDDLDVRGLTAETGQITDSGEFRVETTFKVPRYRELHYFGRVYVAPVPRLSDVSGFMFSGLVESIQEPIDLRNTALLRRRPNDGTSDDVWIYSPMLGKARRVPSSEVFKAPFGQDFDMDSLWGFSGRVEDMQWKLVGETVVLAPVHARPESVHWLPTAVGFDDSWEPRRVYVVEATPRSPKYDYGKRILYVDRESFSVVYSDIYDQSGQLAKVLVNLISFHGISDSSSLAAGDGDFPHYSALVMVDVQSSHATRITIPASNGSAERGWYVNGGAGYGTTTALFNPGTLGRGLSR